MQNQGWVYSAESVPKPVEVYENLFYLWWGSEQTDRAVSHNVKWTGLDVPRQ